MSSIMLAFALLSLTSLRFTVQISAFVSPSWSLVSTVPVPVVQLQT